MVNPAYRYFYFNLHILSINNINKKKNRFYRPLWACLKVKKKRVKSSKNVI